jgi:hypothetical protein
MSEFITIDTNPCIRCSKQSSLTVSARAYAAWVAGELIQVAFPDLSENEREALQTGICRDCWAQIFPPEPGQCSGVCMTGADVGVPEYGHLIAYAHPDCPLHGDDAIEIEEPES